MFRWHGIDFVLSVIVVASLNAHRLKSHFMFYYHNIAQTNWFIYYIIHCCACINQSWLKYCSSNTQLNIYIYAMSILFNTVACHTQNDWCICTCTHRLWLRCFWYNNHHRPTNIFSIKSNSSAYQRISLLCIYKCTNNDARARNDHELLCNTNGYVSICLLWFTMYLFCEQCTNIAMGKQILRSQQIR